MNQNTEKWCYFFVALIFAFLISSFIYALRSSEFNESINIINAFATVVLAVVACYGIRQWKDHLRGTDKYKALIDIKVKFLEFKKIYQAVRLTYFQPIDVKTNKHEKILKQISESSAKQLWDIYYRISDSINLYDIIEPSTKLSLENELSRVKNLMTSYITSIDIYHENVINKNKSNDDTLSQCEKYIYKYLGETDEISQELIRLKIDVFDKIDVELKEI